MDIDRSTGCRRAACIAAALVLLIVATPAAARIVNTRSAADGELELVFGVGFEFEDDEYAMPLLLEWGATERLTLSLEPSFGAVKDDDGDWVRGFGELEAAAIYELRAGDGEQPSIGLEFAVKFPTGSNEELGSGELDYTIGLVLGKELESGELEFNLGYTVVGDPPDEDLSNVIEASIAGEWRIARRLDFIAELVVSDGGSPRGGSLNESEGQGTEGEATVGLSHRLSRHFKIEGGATFASDGSWQGLVAVEWELGEGD